MYSPIVVTTVPAKNSDPRIVHLLTQCWLKPWSTISSILLINTFMSSWEMLYFCWKYFLANSIDSRSSSSLCDSRAWKTIAPRNMYTKNTPICMTRFLDPSASHILLVFPWRPSVTHITLGALLNGLSPRLFTLGCRKSQLNILLFSEKHKTLHSNFLPIL